MSIRDTRIETRRMPATLRPVPSRPGALAPSAPHAPAAARGNPVAPAEGRRKAAARVKDTLSIHRSEPSGLFSSAPATRERLVEGLARIEDLLDRVLSRRGDDEEAATLDLGRGLVADIGRRLQLVRAAADPAADLR